MNNEFHHINELSKQIHEDNVAKGFWEERTEIPKIMNTARSRVFGWPVFSQTQIAFIQHAILSQQLMLVVSEIGEAQEALRKDRRADLAAFDASIESGNDFRSAFHAHVKDTFEDEVADAIIRLMDSAGGSEMDLGRHIMLKLQYNQSRPHKHGKNA